MQAKIMQTLCPETGEQLYCLEGALGRTEWKDAARFERFLLGLVSYTHSVALVTMAMSFAFDGAAPYGRGAVARGSNGYEMRMRTFRELLEFHWQHWQFDAHPVELAELVNRGVA